MWKKIAKQKHFCSYDKTQNLCWFSLTFEPNMVTLSLKNESRNAKIDELIKWSIMHIFNEAEPP